MRAVEDDDWVVVLSFYYPFSGKKWELLISMLDLTQLGK
jgi:hypothetical protein